MTSPSSSPPWPLHTLVIAHVCFLGPCELRDYVPFISVSQSPAQRGVRVNVRRMSTRTGGGAPCFPCAVIRASFPWPPSSASSSVPGTHTAQRDPLSAESDGRDRPHEDEHTQVPYPEEEQGACPQGTRQPGGKGGQTEAESVQPEHSERQDSEHTGWQQAEQGV